MVLGDECLRPSSGRVGAPMMAVGTAGPDRRREESDMDLISFPAGSVAVGVDGSPSSDQAVSWAVEQAVAERRPLTLVHAVQPVRAGWMDQVGLDPLSGLDAMEEDGRRLLDGVRDHVARRAPGLTVHEVLQVADPRQVLLRVAESAAMVVVGSRGRGPVRSLLLGSVSVALSRHAHCPAVVVRPHRREVSRHGILVGVEATARSRAPLEFAFRQASLHDLPLTVLYVYWDVRGEPSDDDLPADVEDERLTVVELLAGMREKYPDVVVHVELTRGMPDVRLVHRAEQMHLVVVGSSAGGPAEALVYGSVASTVVEHAACPVAVVPVVPPD